MYWIVITLWSVQCLMSYCDHNVTRPTNNKELVITGLNESRITKQKQILHYTYNDGEQINMHCRRRDVQPALLQYRDCDLTKTIKYNERTDDLAFMILLLPKDDKKCIMCIQWTEWDGDYVEWNNIKIVLHSKDKTTQPVDVDPFPEKSSIANETIAACVVTIVVVILFIIGSIYFIRSRYRTPLNRLSVNEMDYENLRGRPKIFTTSY